MAREQIVSGREPAAGDAVDVYVYVDSNGAETEFKIQFPSIETFKQDLHDFLEPLPLVVQLFSLQEIYGKVYSRSVDYNYDSNDLQKIAHLDILKEEFIKVLAKCKDSPVTKKVILKMNSFDRGRTAENPITSIRQQMIDLYDDDVAMQHKQETMLGVYVPRDINIIVENILNTPENARDFLVAESPYRAQLTGNYALMRDMLGKSSGALRDEIVALGLIDEVRWPWRRYSLRSLIKEANEKKSPQDVIQQWLDEVKTQPTGFFARRRLARYAREANNLSIDMKVEFLMANHDDAEYFFGNKEFVKSLSQRPDLFFKMLRLPDSKLVYDLFKSPSAETMALARAVNTSQDLQLLKAIKTILQSLALLSWGYRDLIEMTDLAIESAQEKVRRDKGKGEDENREVVESEPRVSELPSEDSVVKLNVDNFSILGDLLQYHQNAKQIMIFSEQQGVIININLNSEPPDVAFYVEENSKVKARDILVVIKRHFPQIKLTSDVRWQVGSDTFQQAFAQGEIPHFGSYQVEVSTFAFRPFGFIGNLFSNLFRVRAIDKIEFSSESDSDTESAGVGVNHARSLSRLSVSSPQLRKVESQSSMNEKTSDEEALEAVIQQDAMPSYIQQYISARNAFRAGNYKESLLLITALFNNLHAKLGREGQDRFLPVVLGLLTKVNADYFDMVMAEELCGIAPYSSTTASGQVTTLHSALVEYSALEESRFFVPNYKKAVQNLNEESLTTFLAGNLPAIQLYMLEIMFKSMGRRSSSAHKGAPKDYTAEEIADINLLKHKYVQIANQCRDDGLAKKIIVRNGVLDFDPEGKPTVERREVTKLFSRDPVITLELRFRASRSLNIAMLKGISPKGKVDYFMAHPEHALFFLKDDGVQKEMAKAEYLTAMINAGSAELRQAIRQSGILERKIKNKEEVIKLLDRVVNKEVQNILKHPELAYAKLENDFLWEEIFARADLISQIQKKYPDIYSERQHTNYGMGEGEAPRKHF